MASSEDGDLDRGPERRDRRDEGELALRGVQPQRHGDRLPGVVGGRGRRRIGLELGEQRDERRVAGERDLAPQPVEQVHAPLGEVGDPRRDPVGMQRDAQDVDGRLEQVRRDGRRQQRHGAVRGDHLPGAVDDQRRIRVVALEDQVDRRPHRRHRLVVEVVALERGRVAGREQHPVALAQRHLEPLGEVQHHRRARPRAPRLDEREVPRRHVRVERELELREPAPLPPVAQQRPDLHLRCAHAAERSDGREARR